jgi:radical SAM protein with 4Fe4S-binding SPASM domain
VRRRPEIEKKLEALQKIDKEEYGVEWELSQSYIGTACDRYSYHMYIDQYGEIRPCIGAMDVKLGNVKTGNNSLEKAWNSKEMQIIRARNYKGKCMNCTNFTEPEEQRTNMAGTIKYKCNSCLGRRTKNLTNEFLLNKGYVFTIGCWNHRPKI